MTRLRRSDCTQPGITRRRCGRGFRYLDTRNRPVTDDATLRRIRALAIPPAWVDVWICPWPNGHIQATGTDAAGRRQYRYHDDWRVRRDAEKFDRAVAFGRALPCLRKAVARDLGRSDLGPERVTAAIVRLLDVGLLRIGGEEYAEEHETFGVSSIRKEHLTVRDGVMRFDYPAKGAIERIVEVRDPKVLAVVSALRRRRGGGEHLFAYKSGRRWRALRSEDVNAYIKSASGGDFSAKDFRTWSATVLAAAVLAGSGPVPESPAARRRAQRAAVATVADQLGNTPAVCRSSYIDPRVLDRYEDGRVITAPGGRAPGRSSPTAARLRIQVESAVIDLLE